MYSYRYHFCISWLHFCTPPVVQSKISYLQTLIATYPHLYHLVLLLVLADKFPGSHSFFLDDYNFWLTLLPSIPLYPDLMITFNTRSGLVLTFFSSLAWSNPRLISRNCSASFMGSEFLLLTYRYPHIQCLHVSEILCLENLLSFVCMRITWRILLKPRILVSQKF